MRGRCGGPFFVKGGPVFPPLIRPSGPPSPARGEGRNYRADSRARLGDHRPMPRPARLILDRAPSPLGELLIVTDETGLLRAIDFHDFEPRLRWLARRYYGDLALETGPAPAAVKAAFARYFAGDLAALASLDWATNGTPFQQAVWRALGAIPTGQTITYSELARRADRPAAIRAAGAANGANPLSLVVPCHRVIGTHGALTGYAGGIERKRWLLTHEGAL
ncbi:methylated-DNA--[protein]-cysteine S-methyltransferase [Caulobacter vibrioides]|uniref:methylated-DNA--[protein]-cysteine S-methyltransferase n=1 Tax=Caulobacter vibrioides TaxID=155892 RepID=UPI000BB494CA|nr:methylated-DNA--[protein]-cysteine S-methyltransferase [Caulobacter vibrioides]ATC23655.1 methylated-DNA--[protein]-cysteine S-methyltransferase [Caulobacter vibrioides]PLR11750.1 methylated-DNA--[protein]-cysteine S-methyltransferase [Caulobacter vibrioides]